MFQLFFLSSTSFVSSSRSIQRIGSTHTHDSTCVCFFLHFSFDFIFSLIDSPNRRQARRLRVECRRMRKRGAFEEHIGATSNECSGDNLCNNRKRSSRDAEPIYGHSSHLLWFYAFFYMLSFNASTDRSELSSAMSAPGDTFSHASIPLQLQRCVVQWTQWTDVQIQRIRRHYVINIDRENRCVAVGWFSSRTFPLDLVSLTLQVLHPLNRFNCRSNKILIWFFFFSLFSQAKHPLTNHWRW